MKFLVANAQAGMPAGSGFVTMFQTSLGVFSTHFGFCETGPQGIRCFEYGKGYAQQAGDGGASGAGLVAWLNERWNVNVTREAIPVGKLPQEFKAFASVFERIH